MSELEKIAEEVRACTKCRLHLTRTNAVPGEGNPKATVMFIGEAPGENEDLQGRPFVGAAGSVLTKAIEEILGLRRSDVFITNVVKCRPPNNRDPEDDEIAACSPYLERQIASIKPKIIVTLGRHSTRYLMERFGRRFRSILAVRGQPFEVDFGYGSVTVFPTLHPAAVLYNPRLRELFEEDFRKLARLAGLTKGKDKRPTILDFLNGPRAGREKGDSDVVE
ncbi:MAG: type-4 uracil-DNA glycosylase [Thermoprotei archaeon]